ncbi:tetratricopeptide repeat protein [Chondromyces apiculatus]|uniref:Uncharacterized protein n=1 Tax=Chondromyces apiculatus DSM 436 TaxID=1192034 RepID=A0A017TA29_9BACT|nr:tetratricopeptide repeat protein [Chondromyces apiculatus]EYF05680.1 Hypothetical protein CAP_2970 [Chondromyces apiculatus DSM 436]
MLSLPGFAGCGAGAPAEAIRPKEASSAEALGEAECRDVSAGGEPLVVDWKPDQRGDLEIAMREGVAVVSYSCEGMKLLKDCHIDGNYGFMGMTRKEQVVRLQGADELRANLPFSGGSIGGELARGSTLDVAMVMVGRSKTTWTSPTKDDLKGQCDGATHFVRGATLGAFAVGTGTSAKVRAAAEIFGAGASGGSTSDKQVNTKEGDLTDCAKATPAADTPPPQCGALIRLVLQPIAKEAPKAPAEPAQAAQATPEVASAEPSCPKGLVLAEGKCTAAASAPAYQCDPKNADECKAQCGKKHAGSCAALGALYLSGSERDPAKAAEAFKTACDGGAAAGCVRLGVLTAEGAGVTKDAAAATKLFEKGCTEGEAAGCGLLGKAYLTGEGVTADPAKAAALLAQACDGGDDRSCGAAGPLYAEGRGVPADAKRAAELYKRACDGSDAPSCDALGMMHETGNGAPKNAIMAGILYQRGCIRGHGDSCADQGRMELAKPGGGNADMARRSFEQACTWRSAVGCAVLKSVYGQNRPVMPDVQKSQALRKSCDSGNVRDCATLGILSAASGNKAGGKMDLDRACTRGDAWACSVAKQLK